ncbi:MAG: hypothetical protein WA549_04540 [Thermoplasmata archaeon]
MSGSATPGSIYNSTPCGLFASLYNASSVAYFSNFSYMFSKLCQTPQFVSLYEGMGPSGFFLVGEYGIIGSVPNLSFTLDWVANCTDSSYGSGITQCSFQANWVGYLRNNTVVGPSLREYPLVYSGGPAVAAAGALTSGLNPWIFITVVGVGVVAASSFVVITVRRRASQREAILLDEVATAHELARVPNAEEQSSPSPTKDASGLVGDSAESTDSLNDLF